MQRAGSKLLFAPKITGIQILTGPAKLVIAANRIDIG